jgi:Trk K+ transport system NAD-binding subunit
MPRESSVVAVVRSRRVVVPRGDTTLAVGDEVIVLVAEGAEEEVKAILTA